MAEWSCEFLGIDPVAFDNSTRLVPESKSVVDITEEPQREDVVCAAGQGAKLDNWMVG
ncbi:MAG: hypothetical protein GF398_18770 [Chitinivibrionales bacterium]|nr:hypothetical protein [Chitinivibrionales bacterium]